MLASFVHKIYAIFIKSVIRGLNFEEVTCTTFKIFLSQIIKKILYIPHYNLKTQPRIDLINFIHLVSPASEFPTNFVSDCTRNF